MSLLPELPALTQVWMWERKLKQLKRAVVSERAPDVDISQTLACIDRLERTSKQLGYGRYGRPIKTSDQASDTAKSVVLLRAAGWRYRMIAEQVGVSHQCCQQLYKRWAPELRKQVNMTYDPDNDVLYCSFGEPTEAIGLDDGNGVVVRVSPLTGQVVGLTISGILRVPATK